MLSDHPTTSSILLLHRRFSSVQLQVTRGLGPRERLRREPRPSGSRHPPVWGPHLRARRERPEPQPRGERSALVCTHPASQAGRKGFSPTVSPTERPHGAVGLTSREKGRGAQAAPVLCVRAGVRSPRAASPETPGAAGTGSMGKHVQKRFFREPVTGADRDSAGTGVWGVSDSADETILPPEYPLPSGAALRKTVVCSGVCWTLICVCVCVFIYVYKGVHVHRSVCLHVYICVCVGVGVVACCCHPLHSFELHADAKIPEQSENP